MRSMIKCFEAALVATEGLLTTFLTPWLFKRWIALSNGLINLRWVRETK